MASLQKLRITSYISIIFLFVIISAFFFILLVLFSLFIPVTDFVASTIVMISLAFFFIFIQWLIAPYIVKWAVHLKAGMEVTNKTNPMVYSIVSELVKKANVKMPKVYIIRQKEPNAFVFGRTKNDVYLVIHSGLLDLLNPDEIKAVIGHEIGHIKHKDFITLTLLAGIPMLTYIIARIVFDMFLFGGISGGKKDMGSLTIVLIVVGFLSFIVYLITQLTTLWLSRTREFYADSFSAVTTNKPENLISSLSKITYNLAYMPDEKNKKAVRAFYAVDPYNAKEDLEEMNQNLDKKTRVVGDRELRKRMEEEAHGNFFTKVHHVFATHPPTYKRIIALLEIQKELEKMHKT
jgi:heat shock protein HtpX